jgi:hypothetical protein
MTPDPAPPAARFVRNGPDGAYYQIDGPDGPVDVSFCSQQLDPAHAQPPAAEACAKCEQRCATCAHDFDWHNTKGQCCAMEMRGSGYSGAETCGCRAFAPQPPAPDTAAEVLAGLVEEMTARAEQYRVQGSTTTDLTAFGIDRAIALVEAAQQRLDGERGRVRG